LTNQQTKDPELVTLLVIEHGAPWPSWAAQLRARVDHSAVEAQCEGESSLEFSERMKTRIAKVSAHGQRLIAAGYMCAAMGRDNHEVRKEICEALLFALDDQHQPELLLGADDWDVHSLERMDLIERWSQLSQLRPKTSVSVCFEQADDMSGVFQAANVRKGSVQTRTQTPTAGPSFYPKAQNGPNSGVRTAARFSSSQKTHSLR
jgi:hypothetical protein